MLAVGYILGFVTVVYAVAIAVGLMKRRRRSGTPSLSSRTRKVPDELDVARHGTKGQSSAGDRAVPADRLRNVEASIDMLDRMVSEEVPAAPRAHGSRVLPLRGRVRH